MLRMGLLDSAQWSPASPNASSKTLWASSAPFGLLRVSASRRRSRRSTPISERQPLKRGRTEAAHVLSYKPFVPRDGVWSSVAFEPVRFAWSAVSGVFCVEAVARMMRVDPPQSRKFAGGCTFMRFSLAIQMSPKMRLVGEGGSSHYLRSNLGVTGVASRCFSSQEQTLESANSRFFPKRYSRDLSAPFVDCREAPAEILGYLLEFEE